MWRDWGGHNVSGFDAPRLQNAFKEMDAFLPASFQTLDTMQLAVWFAQIAGNVFNGFGLTDLCTALGISVDGAHDALADCRMSIEVAKTLTNQLKAG